MKRRYYMAHRRAYYPRVLPIAVPAAILCFAICVVVQATVWQSTLIGLGIGVGSFQTRLTIWRRRHPVISTDEYLQDLRNNATWN